MFSILVVGDSKIAYTQTQCIYKIKLHYLNIKYKVKKNAR